MSLTAGDVTHQRGMLILGLKDALVSNLLEILKGLARETSLAKYDLMEVSPQSAISHFVLVLLLIFFILYLIEPKRRYLENRWLPKQVIQIVRELIKLDLSVIVHDSRVTVPYPIQVLLARSDPRRCVGQRVLLLLHLFVCILQSATLFLLSGIE